jgi:hypothetical protein
VRNEEECVCNVCLFRCNIFIGFRIIKEMPGLVGSGMPYIKQIIKKVQLEMAVFIIGIHKQKQKYNILQYICSIATNSAKCLLQ